MIEDIKILIDIKIEIHIRNKHIRKKIIFEIITIKIRIDITHELMIETNPIKK